MRYHDENNDKVWNMDCFIIRVYRHSEQAQGQPGEIAGLVERVGHQKSSKPFSSYKGLIKTLREEFESKSASDLPVSEQKVERLRLVRNENRR